MKLAVHRKTHNWGTRRRNRINNIKQHKTSCLGVWFAIIPFYNMGKGQIMALRMDNDSLFPGQIKFKIKIKI